MLLLLLLLAGAVAFRYAAPPALRRVVRHAMRWAFIIGGTGFALGFCGPMVFAPDANQGPLLGIFITGPIGFVLGLAYGLFRAWRQPTI